MNDAASIGDFFAAWDLFRDATLAGMVAGGLLGYLGVYVVLRRMVFLSAALSQAAGLGVTLAFWAQIYVGAGTALGSPALGAVLTTLLATLVVWFVPNGASDRRDSVLGFIYLAGSAGSLVVGTRIVEELHDLTSLLFGSAVAVLPAQLTSIVAMAAVLLALHLWWMRGFVLASFDREGAQVRGLPVRLLDATLLGSLALAISVCTRVLGAMPVFAFSVLPAMAAVRCVANVKRALLLATVLGAASGLGGYIVAFLYNFPVGASQALVAGLPVVIVEGWLLVRSRVRLRRR